MKKIAIITTLQLILLNFLLACSNETGNQTLTDKKQNHIEESKRTTTLVKKDSPDMNEIKNGWQLIFKDEFDQKKVDKSKWEVLKRKDNYNEELQAYHPDNVKVENGRLLLIGEDKGAGNKKYTSGLVQTKGKFDFLYGKVEIKGKYPSGKGLFPAVWMLRADEKASLPEIDILESVGHEPELVYMVHHWLENGKPKSSFDTSEISDYDTDHIYGIEWEENEIRWYIDEKLVYQTTEAIPNIAMYLIINLAIGGVWPGSPDEHTVFPALFSIDYVKIYKKVGD